MSPQADYVVSNGTGAAVRSDINGQLSAIVSQNSGATAPATTYAYMTWADTTAGVMKMRNGANNAWITLYQLDGEWSTIAFENGSAAAPSIYFKDSGTDTGIYSPGTDQVAISTGGTGRLFIDSSGRLLAGTSTARTNFFGTTLSSLTQIEGTGGSNARGSLSVLNNDVSNNPPYVLLGRSGAATLGSNAAVVSGSRLGTVSFHGADGTSFIEAATVAGEVDGTPGTNDMPGRLVFSTTADGAASPSERLRITSAGLVGIGTSSPNFPLEVVGSTANTIVGVTATTGAASFKASNTGQTFYVGVDNSANSFLGGGAYSAHLWASGAYPMVFSTNATEKARLTSDGKLLVGTSSARTNFKIGANNYTGDQQLEIGPQAFQSFVSGAAAAGGPYLMLAHQRSGSVGGNTALVNNDEMGTVSFHGADGTNLVIGASIRAEVDGTPGTSDMPGRLVFSTTADGAASPTERMRITNNGEVLIGTATVGGNPGITIQSNGFAAYKTAGTTVLEINRYTSDGTLIEFRQDNTTEGSINVSGTTVSYNGAHLSRWSQLPSGVERTEILRGTVLSNIDEMCEWGDEENEQLNRMKVSDVEGDKNVSGVFQAWDDDDDTYINDFYCAMTGDFIIRIAEGVTVERGDLLMSAGDGTAKPQDDDIIRSKTIAKVTSTNVSCTYEDGSYCVPCVLMAC